MKVISTAFGKLQGGGLAPFPLLRANSLIQKELGRRHEIGANAAVEGNLLH